jgi:hypothetical protein
MNVASSVVLFVAVTALAACATVRCEPLDIVVDAREERMRVLSEPRGVRTDEFGRVRRDPPVVLVPSYWIRTREGAWHEVSESTWRAAEPGRTLSVCR